MNMLRAIILSGLLLPLHVPAGETVLQPYTAVYTAEHGSLHAANTVFTLRRTGAGEYVFSSRAETAGIVSWFRDDVITERSRFMIHEGAIRPLEFEYRHAGGKRNRNQNLRFDWQAGVVHSDYRGEQAKLALKPGMLDHLLLQLALRRDLVRDRLPERYVVVDRNLVKRYKVELTGQARIDTGAGSFDTVIVQREDDGKTVLFWCAPELGYLPVRMEQREPDKSTITLELISHTPLPDSGAER